MFCLVKVNDLEASSVDTSSFESVMGVLDGALGFSGVELVFRMSEPVSGELDGRPDVAVRLLLGFFAVVGAAR